MLLATGLGEESLLTFALSFPHTSRGKWESAAAGHRDGDDHSLTPRLRYLLPLRCFSNILTAAHSSLPTIAILFSFFSAFSFIFSHRPPPNAGAAGAPTTWRRGFWAFLACVHRSSTPLQWHLGDGRLRKRVSSAGGGGRVWKVRTSHIRARQNYCIFAPFLFSFLFSFAALHQHTTNNHLSPSRHKQRRTSRTLSSIVIISYARRLHW